jgi:hypothetical protein
VNTHNSTCSTFHTSSCSPGPQLQPPGAENHQLPRSHPPASTYLHFDCLGPPPPPQHSAPRHDTFHPYPPHAGHLSAKPRARPASRALDLPAIIIRHRFMGRRTPLPPQTHPRPSSFRAPPNLLPPTTPPPSTHPRAALAPSYNLQAQKTTSSLAVTLLSGYGVLSSLVLQPDFVKPSMLLLGSCYQAAVLKNTSSSSV